MLFFRSLYILTLLLILSQFAISDEQPNSIKETLFNYIENSSTQKEYELPLNLFNGSLDERKKHVINDIWQEISEATDPKYCASPQLGQGHHYRVELETTDSCKSKTAKTCRALVSSRRIFIVKSKPILDVVNIYTKDLRTTDDKEFSKFGIKVRREHWEFENNKAFQMSRKIEPESFKVGEIKKIKKCRTGTLVHWTCNTITYKLIKINESNYILIGQQTQTNHEPKSYYPAPDEKSELPKSLTTEKYFKKLLANKTTKEFNSKQRMNAAAGTASVTLFTESQNQPNQPVTVVYELNKAYTDNHAAAKKISKSKHTLNLGLDLEYEVLNEKFGKH